MPKVGIALLPELNPAVDDRWSRIEQYGFAHAWCLDHLAWRDMADAPWHATVPTLAAAAMSTSRIGLGTFVASPNFRHPVPFAKEIATVDEISGGRFVLGVGSGGTGFDATVLGQELHSPRERHQRYVEFVAALDVLLRHEAPGSGGIDLDGAWFTARGARMVGEPAQAPRVPFVLAANGPKGLALVAERAQGWVTTGPEGRGTEEWWAAVAELSKRLDDALEAAGRDPRSIERHLSLDSGPDYSLESVDRFADSAGRAEALGFTDVISHWPRAEGLYAGDEDVLYEVAARF